MAAMDPLALETVEDLQRLARVWWVNILIVGTTPVSDTDNILGTIRQQRGLDVFHAQRSSEFVLPDRGDVILVLDDVCQLSRDQQVRLLDWVSRKRVQIVSFASRSLYRLVCEQKFMDRLYYHLNTVCVSAGER